MTEHETSTAPPIVCDMTGASDTAADRIAEYQRLFPQSLIGREHTEAGIRFRLRADDGVEAWVRDLAAREKACCPFFDFDVAVHDGEVHWDWGIVDGVDPDVATHILDEIYAVPDMIGDGAAALLDRWDDQFQPVMVQDQGTLRQATRAELGLA